MLNGQVAKEGSVGLAVFSLYHKGADGLGFQLAIMPSPLELVVKFVFAGSFFHRLSGLFNRFGKALITLKGGRPHSLNSSISNLSTRFGVGKTHHQHHQIIHSFFVFPCSSLLFHWYS